MYRIGIDLGGTNIKAAILDKDNQILVSDTRPTRAAEGFETVMEVIGESIDRMITDLKALPETEADPSFCGGMTIPGQICGPEGPVLYAPNLGWHDTDPVKWLKERTGIPFILANDADCIALAEAVVGAGAQYDSILMLALGTGVGGAFILHQKIFDGFGAFGGEFGHIPLVHGGRPCPCGITGCFERYCSANGLAQSGREALLKSTRDAEVSSLWSLCGHDPEKLTTRHLFTAAKEGDSVAKEVLGEFFDLLAEGITGLVNIFRPGAVIIGGGLAEAGDALFVPVNEKVSHMTYASSYIPAPPVLKATGGVYTGAIGAALLQKA